MNYTPEQQEDFRARAKAFEEEFQPFYEALKKKHQCELVSNVVAVQVSPGIFANTVTQSIGDLKYKVAPEDVPSVTADVVEATKKA